MKDIVLQGFVNNFAEDYGLQDLNKSTVFEAFSVSTLLRKHHQSDSSDLEDFLTGGTADAGIDALAILVNNHPARTEEDVDFFADKLRRLDVEFVFIQAKTSATFDAGSIGTFTHGVNQFFDANPSPAFREDMERMRRLKDYVYSKGIAMERNPRCYLYYVTTGKWTEPAEPSSRLVNAQTRLESLNLFSSVSAIAVDAERLKTMYRELERGVVKEIEFSRTAVFPRISGVAEAYIGLLPGDQFVDLVTTNEGNLNRELFYDNVRDFQGHNPVNREIAQTLKSDRSRGRFPLLNNGVTIVARSIHRTGDVFRLSDFQVVNGCQTTHILLQNKDAVDNTTYVPVKLVVTNDSEVITEVIKATNRQTAVLPEALESLSPFHKELEDFYATQESPLPKEQRFYYERRSKQYSFDRIKSSHIVTLTAQTKSFVAMFLNEPHSHPRYYGELLRAYEPRLFVADHLPAPYYASGCAFLRVESLFNAGKVDRLMKRWKYHILMLLKLQLLGAKFPNLNSSKVTEKAIHLSIALRDSDTCLAEINRAIATIQSSLEEFNPGVPEHPSRLKAFTALLLERASYVDTEFGDPKVGDLETGKILWYDDYKSFGFIERDKGGDIFVHKTGLTEVPWRLREEGTRVHYMVAEGIRSLKAENVRPILAD